MSESPAVLFVTSTLEVGGSETRIVRIANALAGSGHSVGIAYLNSPDTLRGRIDPAVPVTCLERRGKFSFDSLRRLRRLTAGTTRLVVAVNLYPLLYVLPAARWNGSGFRTACLVNTTQFLDRQWVHGYGFAPFLRRCDRLVYGCRSQRDLWTRKYRLPAQRSQHIYNGVDTNRFSPEGNARRSAIFRSEHGIPKAAFVVGGIGRFAPEKNFELLIRALAALDASGRPVYLVLAGEGVERPKLQAAADAALHGRAVFTGVLEDVRGALAAMDVFVLPSRAVETFSNATLEAMSMARAVVLSNIGGAAEMLVDGQSGYLFESGRLQRLTEILADLHDSPAKREHLGAAARQRTIERFGFDAMIAAYEKLISTP